MRDYIEAIILGIVQGLTEFLPISSSGHLEIFKFLLGDNKVGEYSLLMTVILHGATALATLGVFRKQIWKGTRKLTDRGWNQSKQFFVAILISMIPAALAGFMFEDLIASMFEQKLNLVGFALLVTAVLLWLADRVKTANKEIGWMEGVLIGIAQMFAIIPGLSRSGATIATSILLKIDRGRAAQFSFLMVVPLIMGKMAKDLISLEWIDYPDPAALVVGFIAAFLSGWFACKVMISIIRKSNLSYFSIYCLIAGICSILFSYGILHF